MRFTLLLVLGALATTVCADTTEFKLFRGGETVLPLPLHGIVASIIDADATATTLALNCKDHCDFIKPATITQGPSTYTVSAEFSTSRAGASEAITVVEGCDITSSTQRAYCSASFDIDISIMGNTASTSSTITTTLAPDEFNYVVVSVTAGAEKLAAPKVTASAKTTATGTGTGTATGTVAATATSTTTSSGSANTNGAVAGSEQIGLGQAVVAAFAAAFMGFF
ncbi:putative GPI anchored cell wall protein [Aspergillus clavatus NRRL 1]|uniref:GPI anchored cell wall protein, putative n=1 Tax=Aspergillus clavatus (strain ATCC 1007 / CBS 513.65 / DSM 816 / NCTC 3887 / NRRL 1 / QM 1276 / 107) TaxID=344612 RepID=A1CCZ6_ASPCL|nr:GPI anchored cell wall protein, putative [Aspergillus clavatus NRRL 1]EAW12403.1 GPI anchored cell wall protein, putative [Aspergillus clavatus NRRL 1]